MSVTTQDFATGNVRTSPRRLGLIALIGMAFALRKQRRRLADLDDHLLKDIGLNPLDAGAEAARPLWDVPAAWRH